MAAVGMRQAPILFDPNRVFYKVNGRLSERMDILTEIFNRVLKPLYGPQEKAIRQIQQSKDRTCFLLYDGNYPVGILQYKTIPSDEFAEFGVEQSIEVKSLFVNESQHNSGRGLGSTLIEKLFEESKKLPPHKGFHVTVSEDKQESLRFFLKKGFTILHTWDGRYQEGKKEHLLFLPAEGNGGEEPSRLSSRGEVVGRGDYPDEPELVHVIHNAHEDEVLSLLRIRPDSFVTGSKDNTIVEWDGTTREKIRVVSDFEPVITREERWITALCKVNPSIYASATRSGLIDLWQVEDGSHLKTIYVKTPKKPHRSLKENAARINYLTALPDGYNPILLAGMPTQFNEVNAITSRTQSTTPVHKNDWVFSIKILDSETLLCVIGCSIEFFKKRDGVWHFEEMLFGEPKPLYMNDAEGKRRKQRAFIQTMEAMPASPPHYALARLNRHVEVVDIETKRIVCNWNEHKGRVWHALPISEHVIASSSEDKTIRLWDVRKRNSIHTINSSVGPVDAMMQWDEHTLIATTCPEEKRPDSCGAQLRFYDTRY